MDHSTLSLMFFFRYARCVDNGKTRRSCPDIQDSTASARNTIGVARWMYPINDPWCFLLLVLTRSPVSASARPVVSDVGNAKAERTLRVRSRLHAAIEPSAHRVHAVVCGVCRARSAIFTQSRLRRRMTRAASDILHLVGSLRFEPLGRLHSLALQRSGGLDGVIFRCPVSVNDLLD
jgi:hypothetical protein